MASDILDDDHGVVDHEADGNRERHERQIVQAVIEGIKNRESADQ